jgi:type III secretion protein N (ATPase)
MKGQFFFGHTMVLFHKKSLIPPDLLNADLDEHMSDLLNALDRKTLFRLHGRVLESTSLVIRASVPLVSLGELCDITLAGTDRNLLAQVVGFRENDVFLMPLGDTTGLSPNSQVIPSTKPFTLRVGYQLLGRVLNGLGQPMDAKGSLASLSELTDWPLHRDAPDPYLRKQVAQPLSLGVRVIDSLLTVGKGQRIGLFSGSGVGKSSLMGQMVRNSEAKIVVVCLVGERGREVMEFINETLKE